MKKASFIVAASLCAFLAALALTPPRGPRSMRQFDPARLADLEVRHVAGVLREESASRLFTLLVTMLHEQYRYSWATATIEAFHLARAAATFGDLRGGYEVVLPDLEAAYATAKSWTGRGFDPRAVARAELAWWVARRVPGRNSPEQVGSPDRRRVRAAVRDAAGSRAGRGALAGGGGGVARRAGRTAGLGDDRSLLLQSYRDLPLRSRRPTCSVRSRLPRTVEDSMTTATATAPALPMSFRDVLRHRRHAPRLVRAARQPVRRLPRALRGDRRRVFHDARHAATRSSACRSPTCFRSSSSGRSPVCSWIAGRSSRR